MNSKETEENKEFNKELQVLLSKYNYRLTIKQKIVAEKIEIKSKDNIKYK